MPAPTLIEGNQLSPGSCILKSGGFIVAAINGCLMQRGFIYTEHKPFGHPAYRCSFISSDTLRSHLSPLFASLEKGYLCIFQFKDFSIHAIYQFPLVHDFFSQVNCKFNFM